MTPATPTDIVDLQLTAYNARNLQGFCALFAPTAVIATVGQATPLASGLEEIRQRYRSRFSNQDLCCTVKNRMQLGEFVIDHEWVTGMGAKPVEVAAIYQVRDGLIQSLHFVWPGSVGPTDVAAPRVPDSSV